MEKHKKNIPWTSIRNLLGVLFASVFSAVIFAIFMLHTYGPTGRYLLSSALLAPETLTELSAGAPKNKKNDRFQFDRIEIAKWNAVNKQWGRSHLSIEDYGKLYAIIANDISIVDVSDGIVNEFSKPMPMRLSLFVKTSDAQGRSSTESKPLQVVEFAGKGDYYRVELRGEKSNGEWAYYSHPLSPSLMEMIAK